MKLIHLNMYFWCERYSKVYSDHHPAVVLHILRWIHIIVGENGRISSKTKTTIFSTRSVLFQLTHTHNSHHPPRRTTKHIHPCLATTSPRNFLVSCVCVSFFRVCHLWWSVNLEIHIQKKKILPPPFLASFLTPVSTTSVAPETFS